MFTEEQIRDMERAARDRMDAANKQAAADKATDDAQKVGGQSKQGPAPGDADFASSILGSPKSAPMPSAPAGPAPGDPGFDLSQVKSGPEASAAPPPPPAMSSAATPPPGAGQIDLSGVTPKGFSSGAITLKGELPPGAGQIDTSPEPAHGGGASGPSAQGGSASGPMNEAPSPPPATVIPGGMMPNTEKRETKYGKVVAPGVREAQGEAGQLRMDAAGIQRDAEGALIQREGDAARARMLADQQANADQQRLAEDRERIVGARLAQIESLNKQAAGNPDDLWNSSHVFGRLTGFLMLTLGTISMATGGKSGVAPGIALSMGGKFINGLVNEDIASQSANRTAAAKLAGRQTNLLHLHEENLKDKSKAIEATKLAYYDSILHQMDAYKADHAGEVNEANYRNLQASILEEKAKVANGLGIQEQADVTDEIANKYRPPGVSGGGGAAAPQPGFIVKTPDGTAYSMPNEQQQNKAIDSIGEKQRLIAMNNDITKLREATKKLGPTDFTQRQINIALLEELEQQKLKGIESAEKQGVLREGEYERARALTGYATHGLSTPAAALRGVPLLGQPGDARMAAGDAVIAAQTERWNRELNEIPANASASVVHSGYARNPQTGQLEKRAEYTGQDRKPTPGVAPQGTESRQPGRHVPTAGPSGEEKTPLAPRFPYLPPPAAHHKKKAGT